MAQYQTTERDGIHFISLPSLVESESTDLDGLVKSWQTATPDIHVIDMKDVRQFKTSAYRAFVLFNQTLKANKKKLFCVNASASLMLQFKQDGLVGVFIPAASIDEVKKRAQPAKLHVDVDVINPFIDATVNVLDTQAHVKVIPGKLKFRKPDERIPMEIAGLLALSCAEFTGSIALCFKSEVFLRIYEGLVGEKPTAISQETEDAAGELLNMIFGQAKTVLNDLKGYTLERAIPTVLVGERLSLHHQGRSPAIVLPFESAAGAFHLEILLEKS